MATQSRKRRAAKSPAKKAVKTPLPRKAVKTATNKALPDAGLAAATAQAEALAWAKAHPKPAPPPLGIAAEALGVSETSARRMTALPKTGEDSASAPLPDSYPYRTRLQRREYEAEKKKLQIELLKAQNWIKETGQRVVLLFEGRDAAGKGADGFHLLGLHQLFLELLLFGDVPVKGLQVESAPDVDRL